MTVQLKEMEQQVAKEIYDVTENVTITESTITKQCAGGPDTVYVVQELCPNVSLQIMTPLYDLAIQEAAAGSSQEEFKERFLNLLFSLQMRLAMIDIVESVIDSMIAR